MKRNRRFIMILLWVGRRVDNGALFASGGLVCKLGVPYWCSNFLLFVSSVLRDPSEHRALNRCQPY